MTARMLNRRGVLAGAAAAGGQALGLGLIASHGALAGSGGDVKVQFGALAPFSYDRLDAEARELALKPYEAPQIARPDILEAIDYDAYQKLNYRPELSLALDKEKKLPAQLFHLGRYFKEPVRIYLLEGNAAREVLYSPSLFEMPADHVAHGLPDNAGFAGYRIMSPSLKNDWLAALGASYFRTSGPFDQYGLSARGLAIDTGLPTPEEFPRFSRYYLSLGEGGALVVHGLLESPSVAGAYKMVMVRSTDQRGVHRIVSEIEARLYARKDVKRLGVSPFSSMFWYGKHSPVKGADWRPQIHDSDGLAILTGVGERIWRPLNNPTWVTTSTFSDRDIRGFGLLQRDRDFTHYLDDGVFYERRPSVWVEPLDAWGEGALHLLEIPTGDEIHDNIALYWNPAEPFKAGDRRVFRYRLTWLDDIAFPESLAQAMSTYRGLGGIPGQPRPKGVTKYVIDWHGPVFRGLDRSSGVEALISASRGQIGNVECHPVETQPESWRTLFDLTVEGREPVDLRSCLRRNDTAISETWLFQHWPLG